MAMQTYYPTAASPYLNERTVAVLSIAAIGAPKVATEIDAATSLDLTCAIADWYPDFQQGTSIGRRRACDPSGRQKLNPLELTLPPLEYVIRPSLADTDAANLAIDTLTPGLELYIVQRPDVDKDTAFAALQLVNVFYVRMGLFRPGRSDAANDPTTEYLGMQSLELLDYRIRVAAAA